MVHKMALDGSRDGLVGALRMLSSKDSIRDSALAAKKWCEEAISAVRAAAEPNPWRTSTDDEIADEILSRLNRSAPTPGNATTKEDETT